MELLGSRRRSRHRLARRVVRRQRLDATWAVQEIAAWEDIPDHTRPLKPSLHAVHFIDAQTGWAVGDEGTILTTRNGGER